jgi:Ti-type conjugative transfer relaxase TraA
MLSISKAGGRYYANLAVEDYYTKGGEPPGKWYGLGAEEFRLFGQVDREQFLTLCDGYKLDGSKLVQNAGKENHIAAHDLTFSAPKSVSTLWACGGAETRKEIQAAIWKAAEAGCDYMQEKAAYARRGDKAHQHDLNDIEPAKLTFAMFEHGTSRAQDPQLHIHALALNFGIRADDTTASLENRMLHLHKMAGGAVFRAEFARQLQERLGVEIVPGKQGTFEIRGINRALLEEFSTRRAEIEAAMAKDGVSGAAASEKYTLTTRQKKEHVAREILFEKWEDIGRHYNFDEGQIIDRSRALKVKNAAPQDTRALVIAAVEKLTTGQAYFTEQQLMRHTAEFASWCGVGAKDAVRAVDDFIATGVLIHLNTRDTRRIFTTPEIDQLEKKMLHQVEQSRSQLFPSRNTEPGYLREGLSQEQKRAVYDLTQPEGGIKVVSGMAGAGKTTMLTAAREIWEAQGYEVIGATLAGKTGRKLESETNIPTQTIAKILYDLDHQRGANPFTEKTILVVDEAGMVGTRQMARLIEETDKQGARLVLVGQATQLQPIEHGAPFRVIGEMVGKSELKEIRRQHDERDRAAVYAFSEGKAAVGLRSYVERNLVTFQETKAETVKSLVADWKKDDSSLSDKIIFGTTRETVRQLNEAAQAERLARGELGDTAMTVNGYEVREGDRVMFTKKSNKMGVQNGDLGTVIKVNPLTDHLYVKLDQNDLVAVPLFQYRSLELGYALTTHKMQGQTINNAYVMSGGTMVDRELTYVQMSRHRNEARLYFAVEESGREIANIAAVMNQSRQKEIAQEIRPEYQQERGIRH